MTVNGFTIQRGESYIVVQAPTAQGYSDRLAVPRGPGAMQRAVAFARSQRRPFPVAPEGD